MAKKLIVKPPEVIAWERWLASDEGQKCQATMHVHGQYLQNRLWRAFFAGVKAGRTTVKRSIERGKKLGKRSQSSRD